MNLPNKLTMLRIILIPVFLVLVLVDRIPMHYLWSLIVFLAACITDTLDGNIARKRNLVTDFGKLMDPLADKVMVCTALLCQGIQGVFPWTAIAIVMGKELLMVLGGVFMLRNDVVVYSNMLGKLAQCCFILALTLSFFHAEFLAWGFPLDRLVLWLSVIMTICALIDYAVGAFKTLRAKRAEQ